MKGYILKFYRKINCFDGEGRKDFLVSWLNFDYMEHILVEKFSEYYERSIELSDPKFKNLEYFRQKIYICGNDSQNIFSNEEHKVFPIISVTMVKMSESESSAQKLSSLVSKKISTKGKFEIFQTLSDCDSVLVLRTNSLAFTLRTLSEIYIKENNGEIDEFYTVVSSDIDNIAYMEDNDEIEALIRVSYPSDLKISGDDLLKKYFTFGRNDEMYSYGPGSTKKFVQMFLDNKLLYNSNFMSSTNIVVKTDPFPLVTQKNDRNNVIKALEEKYIKIVNLILQSSYSEMIKTMLVRTILRVTQGGMSPYTHRISNYLIELIYSAIEGILEFDNNISYTQSITGIVHSFNLLLDNCISVNQYNFEFPNNNLRSTGTMVKLLMAYNGLLHEIQDVLQLFRLEIDNTKKTQYFIWCIIDMQTSVSADQLFIEENSDKRFMYFKITPEVMLMPRCAIPYLYHESGHFFRAGWEREVRNRSLRENAYYIFISCWSTFEGELDSYQIRELVEYLNYHPLNTADIYSSGNESATSIKYVHGDQQLKMLLRYFDNLVLAIYDGKVFSKKPNKISKWEMRENVSNYINEMYSAYLESIADVFMIKSLAINDYEDYLDIVTEYLNLTKIQEEYIGLGMKIRLLSICLLIDSINIDDEDNSYQRVKVMMEKIYASSNVSKKIKDVLFSDLDFYDNIACVIELYNFLKNEVSASMENIMDRSDQITDHITRIRKTYQVISQADTIENGLKFIDDYMIR